MLNTIKNILSKSGIAVWRVTEVKSQTAELYFIKKKLDIPRYKESTQYQVTVFNDFEKGERKFRGVSSAILTPGMSDEEIESRIKSAYLAASFVANPFYELADPVKEDKKLSTSDLSKMELSDAVLKFSEAIFSVDNDSDAFLNSVEIFANRSSEHIIGSNGLDVSFDTDSISGELVAQCVTPTDVEQFRQFAYKSFDIEAVKEKIKDAIEDVRARAKASSSPKAGNYDIILKDDNLTELFQFYGGRSNAAMIVPGYSQWKVGDCVQGDNIVGEKLNITLESVDPYSVEGIPTPTRKFITDGKLELVYGSTRFCRYLGIAPTGDYDRVVLDNGTKPLAEMRTEGVLEPISFSDFQMDVMDGHFKGEIRLALLHHADGSVEELTGGSINGSLIELQNDLVFSKERYESLEYSGPLAVLIKNVAVAGK